MNDIRILLRTCQEAHLQQSAIPLCKLIVQKKILDDRGLILQTMRIARGVGSKELILELIALLQKHPTDEIWKERGVVAGLIHSCIRLELFEAGLQAHEILKKHGIEIDKSVKAEMLCLYVIKNPTANMSRILESDQVSDFSSKQLQMIVRELLRYENSDGAIRLIEHCNVDLNVARYTKLIDVCYRKGDIENATKYAKAFYHSNAFDSSLKSYNAVIQVHGRTGQLAKAFQLYEKMKKLGVAPNVITLKRMLHAQLQMIVRELLRYENSDGAIRLIEHCNVDLNVARYTKLIDVCYRKGDIENATKYAKAFYHSNAFDSSLKSYNAVIQVHGRTGQLAKAFQLYEKMKKLGVAPNVITLKRMLHAVYFGRYPSFDVKITKYTLLGLGAMGAGLVPFMQLQEHYLTTLFIASVLGSMSLAIYMVPNGVMRSLYPDVTKPRKGDIINAFFRRLSEEGHAGRAMYLWREMIKWNVAPDASITDIFVRVCIRKRHPEYAYNTLYSALAETSLEKQTFRLSASTTTHLIHSLISQSRTQMASEVFRTAREQKTFTKIFHEEHTTHWYELSKIPSVCATSFFISQILATIREKFASDASVIPRVEFTVWNAIQVLDHLDEHEPAIRALFSIDQLTLKRQNARPSHLLESSNMDSVKLTASPQQLRCFISAHPNTQ
ncbi:hypothetical protein ABG067_005843 [Albugo candida]